VTETLGRVEVGEVVSIKYLGDVEGAKYVYPNFRVSRKPASAEPEEPIADEKPAEKGAQGDDIPY